MASVYQVLPVPVYIVHTCISVSGTAVLCSQWLYVCHVLFCFARVLVPDSNLNTRVYLYLHMSPAQNKFYSHFYSTRVHVHPSTFLYHSTFYYSIHTNLFFFVLKQECWYEFLPLLSYPLWHARLLVRGRWWPQYRPRD